MSDPARSAWYDVIGRRYAQVRRPDARLESAIWSALGAAESVVNVGAGTGSYEPADRDVIAVEPSEVMIAQRHSAAARALTGRAEALPLDENSVPIDCSDGFMAAFWGRPEAYLDPTVRAATSSWHQISPTIVDEALARLARDLDDRVWDARHGDLRQRPAARTLQS